MTASKLFDFLGRVLMAAVFVNALPAKFTNFAETEGFIASKGIPEPLASVLLVAAIVVLIAGSILLVFGSNTVLGASLLLLQVCRWEISSRASTRAFAQVALGRIRTAR